MTQVSKRGRPPGSSWLNAEDYPRLQLIADRIILDPTMKPTTAMREVGILRETEQRRLRAKWNANRGQYLADALDRRQAAQRAAFERGLLEFATVLGQIGAAVRQVTGRAIERYQRWADENPEQAATLRHWAEHYRTAQLKRIAARG